MSPPVSPVGPPPLPAHAWAKEAEAGAPERGGGNESWASSSSCLDASGGGGAEGAYHTRSCPICLERFGSDNPAKVLPCRHAFHVQCIESWRQRSRQCPMCQSLFMGSDVLGDGRRAAQGVGAAVVGDGVAAAGADDEDALFNGETLEAVRRRTAEDEALARRIAREEEAAALLNRRARIAVGQSLLMRHGGAIGAGATGATRRSQRHLMDGESDASDLSGGGDGSDGPIVAVVRSAGAPFAGMPPHVTAAGRRAVAMASEGSDDSEGRDDFSAHNEEAVSLVVREGGGGGGGAAGGGRPSAAASLSISLGGMSRRAQQFAPLATASSSQRRRGEGEGGASSLQQMTFFQRLGWLASCCRGAPVDGTDDHDAYDGDDVEAQTIRRASQHKA